MIANRTNSINTFPLPVISNVKWWEDMEVDKAFKKGTKYRINAGASCLGTPLKDDKKEDKSKKGKVNEGSKKNTPSKDNKKNSKKNSEK